MTTRERALDVRRLVNFFRLLRERRGTLTFAQLPRMSRLLTDHADALYRRADCVERGDAAPRLLKAHSFAALAARVRRVGHTHDPVTQSGPLASLRIKDNAVVNPKAPTWSPHLCEFLVNRG